MNCLPFHVYFGFHLRDFPQDLSLGLWKFNSSRMLHSVDWYLFTDVSGHSNFDFDLFKIRDSCTLTNVSFRLISARGGGSFPNINICNMTHTRYWSRFDCNRSIINSQHLTKHLRLACPLGVCPHLNKSGKSDICSVAKYIIAWGFDIFSRRRLKNPQRFKEVMSPSLTFGHRASSI